LSVQLIKSFQALISTFSNLHRKFENKPEGGVFGRDRHMMAKRRRVVKMDDVADGRSIEAKDDLWTPRDVRRGVHSVQRSGHGTRRAAHRKQEALSRRPRRSDEDMIPTDV
jgi:hypothetical protein